MQFRNIEELFSDQGVKYRIPGLSATLRLGGTKLEASLGRYQRQNGSAT